jgi:hypothetical protein
MDVSQEKEQQDKSQHKPSSLSERLGDWAFDHKDTFNSTGGKLLFRNGMRSALAILPYAFVNAGVFQLFAKFVHNKDSKLLGAELKHVLADKQGILQSWAAIAFSFTTFRSTCKMIERNYDRIFGAETKEDAEEAVKNLPSNIVADYKQIVPREFCSTGPAAITLAAIRSGINNPPGTANTFRRDYVANSLGYAAFFDLTGRLYDSQSPKDLTKLKRDVDEMDANPDDTPGKIVIRNAGAAIVAAVPYMIAQRAANRWTGGTQNNKLYLKNVAAVDAAFIVPFAIYTMGMDAWKMGYDKFTGLKPKENKGVNGKSEEKSSPDKPALLAQVAQPQSYVERIESKKSEEKSPPAKSAMPPHVAQPQSHTDRVVNSKTESPDQSPQI